LTADPRFLGRSTRERNARVAARAGAALVPFETLASLGTRLAVLVPPAVAIDVELFAAVADRVAVFAGSTRIDAADGEVRASTTIDDGELAVCRGASGTEGRGCVFIGPACRLTAEAAHPAALDVLPSVSLPVHSCLDVSTAAARRQAAWIVLRRTQKPTDGWVSRTFNRPISRAFSYVLLSLGLSANHASVLTLLLGLAAAAIAAQPGYAALVTTGILFQLASILDGVDGEMARSTLSESESGARLDTIVDQLTYVACFAGVTTGWVLEGGGRWALGWTTLVGVALLLSLARGGRFVARHAENASFVFIDRAVRRAARDTRIASLQLAAAAFTVLRRDVFAVIFLAVSLTGRRALVPSLIACGVMVANLTFSRHHRELAEAAAAERLSPTLIH
jgi:phosphatidylglycerophosphate synthase